MGSCSSKGIKFWIGEKEYRPGETCCQVGATVNNMYFKITAYISKATLQNDTGEDRFAKQLD